MRTEKSYCRVCHACCGVEVDIVDGRVVAVRGDRSDPMSHGFICSKGRAAPEQHHGAGRLTHSLARAPDGAHRSIAAEAALEQIAGRIASQIERFGPESTALYIGTQANLNALTPAFAFAFASALGTPRLFGTMTIDQSAKWIADGRLGSWRAGIQRFDEADVWMLVGANPLVSMSAAGGSQIFLFNDPVRSIKAAKARGCKLIIMDPRESEIARYADLHLRLRPGQDVPVLAALCRIIIERGWHDSAFLATHAAGLDALREALSPFTPEAAAAAADIPVSDIEAAAAMFARDARSGMCGGGTGVGMAVRSNLAEHLIGLLNVVTGRFPRAGDAATRIGVLQSCERSHEGVAGGDREWEQGPHSLVHGLGRIRGQAMTATLADEILDAGERRIRTLIAVGGNPATALPDQARARRALAALDLLVTVDPRRSATAEMADFILAPTLPFERADHTGAIEGFFREPYAHYARALVAAPDDVVDDWYIFWRIASHLGLSLSVMGETLVTDRAPSRVELLDVLGRNGRVSLEQVRAAGAGRLYPAPALIDPAPDDAPRQLFDLMPPDVRAELAEARRALDAAGVRPRFQLIVRRLREVMNSAGSDFMSTRRKWLVNPAFLHPDDIAMLKLSPGTWIRISHRGRHIRASIASDPCLRRGTVSIAHCWSGDPSDVFSSTSMLIDHADPVESINRMPVMTGIEVDIVADTYDARGDFPSVP